jgi:hypothetical protein
VSAFSKEVDDILATPEPVVTPDEGSIHLMLCREATSDNGRAEIVYPADRHTKDKNQKREELKVNTADVPRGGVETLSSPQPQHKASISKVYKISGLENAPTYRQTTPTGHNSEKKVQRVTGLGVPSEEIEQHRQIRREHKIQVHGEVSPLSNTGSDLSPEERTAVSAIDGNAEGCGWGRSSEPAGGYFSPDHPARHRTGSDASALPSPLRVTKARRPNSSERELLSSTRYSGHSPHPVLVPRVENEQASPREIHLATNPARIRTMNR